ncbi:ATP-binding protein [Pelosinus sp. sgz500959]|uniref:ATP-binding protein n=1 Tax=Pelosinus sp. sgz500959 TaxID=3242472 RepID=UPI0036725014
MLHLKVKNKIDEIGDDLLKNMAMIEAFIGNSPALRKISIGSLLFAIVLLCFIWGGLNYKIQDEREMEISGAIKDTASFSRAFEEHTASIIKSMDQTVLFLKYQYENGGSMIDIPQYIREGTLTSQPFVLLSIINENGDLVASSQVPFVASNIKDREHFLVHKNIDSKQLYISKPVLGRSSGKWSIQMTRRINKPDGSFGGVVVVSLDPFYFNEFYKKVHLVKNSSIELVGRDGIIRVRQSGENTSIGQELKNMTLMENLVTGDVGYYIEKSPVDDIERIHSYQALKEYPLVVVVGIDKEEVLEFLNQRITIYYMLAEIITAVIIIFVIMLLRTIRQQKNAEEALKIAYEHMETKVEERTQELFAMNEELISINEELLNEVIERKRTEGQLGEKNVELEKAYIDLKGAQSQVIQQEKMASIGQLAAGVAHEINNPMAFIISNLSSLRSYVGKLIQFISTQEEVVGKLVKGETEVNEGEDKAILVKNLADFRRKMKIEYIIQDAEDLIKESLHGADRVKVIVQDLKGFARLDNEQSIVNINEGITSTINIIWNEIKYKATLKKEFGEIPLTKCNLGQLNQVFMNILVNAAQAIEVQGEISVKTWFQEKRIFVSIADTGVGIPPEIVNRIFEPFFTTKAVGKGTGLGLSVTYDIIKKHEGEIRINSEIGKGTTVIISIPVIES